MQIGYIRARTGNGEDLLPAISAGSLELKNGVDCRHCRRKSDLSILACDALRRTGAVVMRSDEVFLAGTDPQSAVYSARVQFVITAVLPSEYVTLPEPD